MINNIEKGSFLKLFNRGGYVLDFSTNDFDNFTLDSIGIALCSEFGLSKGKSLTAYIEQESNTDNIIKLYSDLLSYYELNFNGFQAETSENGKFYSLYNRCKMILEREKSTSTFSSSAEELKEKFSSEYINQQLTIMLNAQKENPTEAIGKAKELIESCCKTILENHYQNIDKKWDIVKLVDTTFDYFELMPKYISDTANDSVCIKAILGNLKAIAQNVAALRNNYGSGHGKSSSYKGLQERHAKLAIGASITLVNFLWDSNERINKKIYGEA